jgi:hypothetical protein
MGKLFRNWDLLKAMIVAFLVAAGTLAVWNQVLAGQAEAARKAFERSKSELVTAHKRLEEIQPLRRAVAEQGDLALANPDVYFQNQLVGKAGFASRDFSLFQSPPQTVPLGADKAEDTTMTIDILPVGKETRFLPRANWFAAIYNCEKNSNSWRLRALTLRAKEDVVRQGARDAGYPEQLSDEWQVSKLVFASRRPPPRK